MQYIIEFDNEIIKNIENDIDDHEILRTQFKIFNKSNYLKTLNCNSCKKNLHFSYFTSIDGHSVVNNGRQGYMTCTLCRIYKNNLRYDKLMKKRGYCNFIKMKPLLTKKYNFFIKGINY